MKRGIKVVIGIAIGLIVFIFVVPPLLNNLEESAYYARVNEKFGDGDYISMPDGSFCHKSNYSLRGDCIAREYP